MIPIFMLSPLWLPYPGSASYRFSWNVHHDRLELLHRLDIAVEVNLRDPGLKGVPHLQILFHEVLQLLTPDLQKDGVPRTTGRQFIGAPLKAHAGAEHSPLRQLLDQDINSALPWEVQGNLPLNHSEEVVSLGPLLVYRVPRSKVYPLGVFADGVDLFRA